MSKITDAQIRELLAETCKRPQTARTRALCNNCVGALKGSVVCRESCAVTLANQQKFTPRKKDP